MIRIFTLCALSALGVNGLVMGQTETTSVSVTLGLVAVYDDPTCTISGGTSVDFGTVTSPRSSQASVTSSGTSVTVTGTNVKNVTVDIEHDNVFGYMENSGSTRIPYTTALSRDNCGCANHGGSIRTITCTCDVSGTARVPAQAAAGSYSGTSTLSASCSQ